MKKTNSENSRSVNKKSLLKISKKLGVAVPEDLKNIQSTKMQDNEVVKYLTASNNKALKMGKGKGTHTAKHTNTSHTNSTSPHTNSSHTNVTYTPPQPAIPPSHTNIAHTNTGGKHTNTPAKDTYTDYIIP